MRILALDFGTVRIGIAISDESKMIGLPLEMVPAQPFTGFLERLRAIIREKEVELIIVGMPRNMNGTYGPAAQRVREFVTVLKEALPMPIQTWDERLTSAQAERALDEAGLTQRNRRGKVDQMAAALLLQNYLDSLGLGPAPS